MADKPMVISHSPCLDGATAAWAYWLANHDAEFVPGVYGQAPPDVTGRAVVLLDFSYKRDVMLALMREARTILVLDHHKTAQAELANLDSLSAEHTEYCDVMLVFNMAKSGARLAWEHFHPSTAVPKLVQYVEDRDLGRIWSKEGSQLLHCRAINAALFSYAPDFTTLTELSARMEYAEGFSTLAEEGYAIERKQAKDVAELVRTLKHRRVIGGTEVWCANLPYTMASDAANLMAEGEPFAATYFIDADAYAVFSLRSTETGVDVSAIAKRYGGGGHRQAAGFRIPVTAINHDLERDVFLGALTCVTVPKTEVVNA